MAFIEPRPPASRNGDPSLPEWFVVVILLGFYAWGAYYVLSWTAKSFFESSAFPAALGVLGTIAIGLGIVWGRKKYKYAAAAVEVLLAMVFGSVAAVSYSSNPTQALISFASAAFLFADGTYKAWQMLEE